MQYPPDQHLLSIAHVAHAINALVNDVIPPSTPDSLISTSVAANASASTIIIPLPLPLTSHLIAIGLQNVIAECLSRSYLRAATRLKAQVETDFTRVFRACIDASVRNGTAIPESQYHIRVVYQEHFVDTVNAWASRGMAMTRERLMIVTLKGGLRVDLPPKVIYACCLAQRAN